MEYRVLKYFLAVAREENITKASEVLHLSQPALSRQLMQLEEELGTELFIRGKRKITLTPAGTLLRRRALEIIELTEKAGREVRSQEGELEGVISIGSGEGETFRLFSRLMVDFQEQHPRIKFDLYTNNGDFIRERLERGLLDIGIIFKPKDLEKYDYLKLPDRERNGVIVPADSPLASKEYITPEDLIGQNLLLSKRAETLGFAQWAGESFAKYTIPVTYNLAYNAALLVSQGAGVAQTIEGAVSLYRNPDILFKPFYPTFEITSCMVWKKNQPQPPAVASFIAYVKQQLTGGSPE